MWSHSFWPCNLRVGEIFQQWWKNAGFCLISLACYFPLEWLLLCLIHHIPWETSLLPVTVFNRSLVEMGTRCHWQKSTIFMHVLGMCPCYFYPCLFQLCVLTWFKCQWSIRYDKKCLPAPGSFCRSCRLDKNSADKPKPGCHKNRWNSENHLNPPWKFQLSRGLAMRLVPVSHLEWQM